MTDKLRQAAEKALHALKAHWALGTDGERISLHAATIAELTAALAESTDCAECGKPNVLVASKSVYKSKGDE